MSHIDPVDVVANVASGGLYGAGKSLAEGRPGSALENLGPFGSAVHPISPQVANAGNLAGAGAGLGGALAAGGIGGGGTGAATPATLDPYYFGFEPSTLQSAGTSEFGQFAGGIPTAGMTGAPAAGLSAGIGAGGAGNTGALVGAGAGQQLAQLLGGGSPLSMPTPVGGGGGAGGSQGLTPQQLAALTANQSSPLAALTANQSSPHQGLAPQFQARQAGKQEAPGIANAQDLALASLYGLGGGR